MLHVQAIETAYGTSQVLFGVTLDIQQGEIVALLGRNGMGKTTTVRSIMGLTPPHSGTITFDGQRIAGCPSHVIANRGIGLVPEGRHIFPNLTVEENLIATARNRFKSPSPWTVERIYDLFPSLKARKRNMGNQLSGGEQQMLAVGRALLTNPKLLILDEATEGLAPVLRTEIWRCVRLLKEEQQAILLIDTNLKELLKTAERAYILEKGRIAWSGSSLELSSQPELQQRYLGV